MTDFGLIAGITRFLKSLSHNDMYYGCDEYISSEMYDKLDDMGFTVIGQGSYRITLQHKHIPEVVFKVAYANADYSACKLMGLHEYEFYTNSATENDKKHLAECYHAEDYVSVMEFINGGMVHNWKSFHRAIGHKELPEFQDAFSGNLLYKGKVPVLIDYTLDVLDFER